MTEPRQVELMSGRLAEVQPLKGLSADRKRTLERKRLLERGVNPGSTRAFLEVSHSSNCSGEPCSCGGQKTCGDCWHAIASGRGNNGGTFWKCERGTLSHSAASDIRLSWPACELFSATNDGKSPAPYPVRRASLRKKGYPRDQE